MPWKRSANAAIKTSATGRFTLWCCLRLNCYWCQRRWAKIVSSWLQNSDVPMRDDFKNASAAASSPAKDGPSSTNVTGLMSSKSPRCACRQAVDAGSKSGSSVTKSTTTDVSTTHAVSVLLALPQGLHRLRSRLPRTGWRILAGNGDQSNSVLTFLICAWFATAICVHLQNLRMNLPCYLASLRKNRRWPPRRFSKSARKSLCGSVAALVAAATQRRAMPSVSSTLTYSGAIRSPGPQLW